MQARFGITHGCRRVAILVAKVTLAVYQQVAHVPVLRHTYHGVVNGSISVRVILTHYFTHNTGAFLVRFPVIKTQFVHGVKHPAVYRLQSIAHIGQGTAYYYRHRIIDVGRFHLLLNIYLDNSVKIVRFLGQILFFHTFSTKFANVAFWPC